MRAKCFILWSNFWKHCLNTSGEAWGRRTYPLSDRGCSFVSASLSATETWRGPQARGPWVTDQPRGHRLSARGRCDLNNNSLWQWTSNLTEIKTIITQAINLDRDEAGVLGPLASVSDADTLLVNLKIRNLALQWQDETRTSSIIEDN